MKIKMLKCGRCNGEWIPRVAKPRKCPLCQNRNWNKHKCEKVDVDLQKTETGE